jgi:riboflavin kinase/FMN adenylyltransferase
VQLHYVQTLDDLDIVLSGSSVTIGVFDGLHLGHQSIFDRLLSAAARRQTPSVCITFSVHPKSVLTNRTPQHILSLEHRLELIEALGVDVTIVIEFGPDIAQIEPEQFVEELLVRKLGIAELIIGHDTTIGRNRRGDSKLLVELGLRHGFEVVTMGEVIVDGLTVSSTAVRRAIATGELITARRLLGRPVSLLGRIVHGDGRGAAIGFATANLEVTSEAFPPLGVYAVTAKCALGSLPGVMNYGMRPTFRQAAERAVFEVHLLDHTDLSLYGERMEVFLHKYLRRERRFQGPDELKQQIFKDIAAARVVLDRISPTG